MKIGDWEGQPIQLDARQLAMAEAVGHLARRYVHRRTGDEMTVVVLCGRPGPISVHSPEVCYSGAGFSLNGERETFSLPGGDRPTAEFFRGPVRQAGGRPRGPGRDLGLEGGRGLEGVGPTRGLFSHNRPCLYKIYVIRRLSHPDEKLSQEPSQDFLRAFLPELDKRVSPVS